MKRPGAWASRLGLAELSAASIALLASVAIGSVLILIVGASPGEVWWEMISRTANDPAQLGLAVYKATSLALAGLGVALALDVGLFNIGAESQLTVGAIACAAVGAALPSGTPAVIAIPACIVAAAAAGGAVGGLIGALRVYRGAHEVITSIMLNEIIGALALWFGTAVLFRDGMVVSAPIIASAELPELPLGGSEANTSVALAVMMVGTMWWLRSQTTWGQAWRAVGRDPAAASSVGIGVGRVQLLAMIGSGALAGMASVNFVLGHEHAYENGLGSGVGFLAISAALLGRMHPVGIAIASALLGFLSAGGLAVNELVPKELTEMLQGVVVLCVAASAVWVRKQRAVAR